MRIRSGGHGGRWHECMKLTFGRVHPLQEKRIATGATTRAMSPKGNGWATKPATSAAGPPIPATRVTATSVHEAPTSRRQDRLDSRCNTTTNRSRPKRCATVPAGKTDPMGARVMYTSPMQMIKAGNELGQQVLITLWERWSMHLCQPCQPHAWATAPHRSRGARQP